MFPSSLPCQIQVVPQSRGSWDWAPCREQSSDGEEGPRWEELASQEVVQAHCPLVGPVPTLCPALSSPHLPLAWHRLPGGRETPPVGHVVKGQGKEGAPLQKDQGLWPRGTDGSLRGLSRAACMSPGPGGLSCAQNRLRLCSPEDACGFTQVALDHHAASSCCLLCFCLFFEELTFPVPRVVQTPPCPALSRWDVL